MSGVRGNDQKGRLVPYTPASNGTSGGNIDGNGGSNNPYTAYDGKKAKDLASYNGNNNSTSTGTGSGNFTKGSNHTAGAGNYVPSAPGNDFGTGSGNFGGTTRGAADFGNHAQSVPQGGGPAQGYPVINHGGGGGGPYVATPVPVSNWHGSAPKGPQQNGGFTTNGAANMQLEGSGKTFGSGGAGGYGPQSPHGYGGQNGSLSGSEKHHHHHYYYNNNHHQHHPVPYSDKNPVPPEERRRRRGAGALAAALIACWACTCCCHAPCGC